MVAPVRGGGRGGVERGRRKPDRGEGRRRKERKYLVDYCALLVIDSDSGSGFLGRGYFFVSFCPPSGIFQSPSPAIDVQKGG